MYSDRETHMPPSYMVYVGIPIPGSPNPGDPGHFLNPEIPGLGGSNPGLLGLKSLTFLYNNYSFHSDVYVCKGVLSRRYESTCIVSWVDVGPYRTAYVSP
jgi:hypothetical protein